jgi:hypothetical protein
MYPVITLITQVVSAGVLILLQFISAFFLPGFFFFPAGMLYMATFLPLHRAVLFGCVAGSIFDGMSPLPFGFYTVGMGGGMALANIGMWLMNERHIGAHGIAAFLATGMYAIAGIIYYVVTGSSFMEITLYFYDMVIIFTILLLIVASHTGIRKAWR